MARRSPDHAAQTRAALLDAALAVFAERGFAAAQLEDIARRAQVTRGALYHHFDGKPALFRAVLGERWDTVMAPASDELRTRPPNNPLSGAPGPEISVHKNPLKAAHPSSGMMYGHPPRAPRDSDAIGREGPLGLGHRDAVALGAPSGIDRRVHKQVRSFVSTFLHLVEVDPRARALLRMSLSGDHQLPELAGQPNEAPAGPPAVDPLGAWERALGEILTSATGDPHGTERAHALLAGLIGHAVWVSIRGTGESSVVALGEVLCEGALGRSGAPL